MIFQTDSTYEILFDEETQAVSVSLSCSAEVVISAILHDLGDWHYLPLCQTVNCDGVVYVFPISLAPGDHSIYFVEATLDDFAIAFEGSGLGSVTKMILANVPIPRQRAPILNEPPSNWYMDDDTWFWDDGTIFWDE
jgi:hypothetical protein